ncbi:MAG TPA: HDIG domain-containing protein [Opitutaceae bacterium]|jgi:putative nucleotidyltransferase with HDIG domain|nr:HDIG domain-containing protein [Opitutaceae bacterium]
MSLIKNLKLLRGGLLSPRRVRKTAEVSAALEFLEKNRAIAALIFIATVAAIVLVSSVGVGTADLPVLPNQLAAVRIVASTPFSYTSVEKTRAAREQFRSQVPPVYKLDFSPLQQFEKNLRELVAQLEKIGPDYPNPAQRDDRQKALEKIVDDFNAGGLYRTGVDDVALLLSLGDAKARFSIIENGLATLHEIYDEGIHDSSLASARPDTITVFQIIKGNGEIAQRPVQSLDEALTFLRINLAAEGISRETTLALFRIFENGVTPNLVYDPIATGQLQDTALKSLKPVVVSVVRGQTIIEPGLRVTPEQYEMLVAQRRFLLDSGNVEMNEDLQLFGRVLLVLAMVWASVIYIRIEDRETLQSNGRLALLALVVIINLALVRLTYSLSGLPYFIEHDTTASILPYTVPTAFAPIIVAILIDAGSGIFMALLVSIFASVIYGNRLDLLVLTFLASLVAIFSCRGLRKRSRVVRGAVLGGLVVAVFALLIGVVDQLRPLAVMEQMAAGLGTGLFTGVAIVGLLPVLEGLFKRTTDITLLELSDFNHPLLRLLQMEAPGTYHHSLIVAQLAENAANAIDANPLLARVCAQFHDVGKIGKPEYFSENQRNGFNPHETNNPSLSALIIKSHVKDGVDLALKHKLPKPVIDVIQQHHGTTLLRYFFERAKHETRAPFGSVTPFSAQEKAHAPRRGDTIYPISSKVSEVTYRYDGPKPQFKESAVIMLADGVEAASRSLRKVTPQHLAELIEQIFRERIADGQLDEAPLTFEEMTKIKSSFNFTMLNMLHSRVAYPPGEGKPEPRSQTS